MEAHNDDNIHKLSEEVEQLYDDYNTKVERLYDDYNTKKQILYNKLMTQDKVEELYEKYNTKIRIFYNIFKQLPFKISSYFSKILLCLKWINKTQ